MRSLSFQIEKTNIFIWIKQPQNNKIKVTFEIPTYRFF